MDDEDPDTEDEKPKGEREINEDKGTVTTADKTFAIMSQMKAYSDFTNTKWSEVWDINIIEFFQMIAFIKEYKRKEQEMIKKYQKTHKW